MQHVVTEAYRNAQPWIIEDTRELAQSLSGKPVWMPDPEPGEELDADRWIKKFAYNDHKNIRSDPAPKLSHSDKRRLILDLLADSELTSPDIAASLDFTPNYVGSLLVIMENENLVERGDGTRRNGRRTQTWRLFTADVVPDISLDEYLAGLKEDSKCPRVVQILKEHGPLRIGKLIELSGFAAATVHKHTAALRRRGLAERRRIDSVHRWFLTGDARAERKTERVQIHVGR